MTTSPDWLRRYRDGYRDQVWQELRQLGGAVRELDLAEEAQLVCDEMARRARRNVELIIGRLTVQGYQFHTNDDAQTAVTPYFPPGPGAPELAGWLQERFGAVPMTLLSWVRLVGDVWLVGTHPQWLHKDNTSGGAPYGIILPDACVDGLFAADPPMPFVSYLNWVFRNGGFPWPTGSQNQWHVKHALAKDLLPL